MRQAHTIPAISASVRSLVVSAATTVTLEIAVVSEKFEPIKLNCCGYRKLIHFIYFVLIEKLHFFFSSVYSFNRTVGRAVTRSFLEREV